MNGVHDMGGMQDMGPIQPEKNEPVFHHPWEGRVFAMYRAAGRLAQMEHRRRALRERTDSPAEYLRMSYYEKWYAGLVDLLTARGWSPERRSKAASQRPARPKRRRRSRPRQMPTPMALGASTQRNVAVAPRFQAGQRVRARNINPVGHTRLPRYARGKLGTVDRDHGVFVFPDTNAQFLGENPQHVTRCVSPPASCGATRPSRRMPSTIEMWDDYLEPA